MTKKVIFRVVFLSLGILLIVSASYGQTTQINGAASGNWSNTASWSPAMVPNNGGGNTYDVTLLSSPAVNITLDISPTIDTLTLDSGSILSTDAGTTLTTTGVTNGGDIEFYNGNTLTVNGSMTTSNYLDLDKGSKLIVTGNLTNSGQMYTNVQNDVTATNTITVDGTFTNNAGATTTIGNFSDTTDVLNVATLVNAGSLTIDPGATLNLTSQPNGITDVVQGSLIQDFGTMKAGTANAFANLGSIEGVLVLGSGQTITDTPGSGALTISSTGELDLEKATNLTVSGNLTNSGQLYTNVQNDMGGANTLTVTGTFTNNAGAHTTIGNFSDTADVMNVATLVNNGSLTIDLGATLNLTGQPNGITDVVQGSLIQDFGAMKAGTANAFAKLGSTEGVLVLGSGQTITDTPGSGTLTISSTGELDLEKATNLTVAGNLTNSGLLYTNVQNDMGGANTLTVTGAFTNNAGAATTIGNFSDTADVMNVATLVNSGSLTIDSGATLNLTGQPNGITDVVQGSLIQDFGTMKASTANAFAKLGSTEGVLVLGSGQTITDTPGSGTLTISSTGELDLEKATNLTVSGNLTNSGQLYTNIQNDMGGANTLTVTGAFTNNAGATTTIGNFRDTADMMNVATLVNNGSLTIGLGATLNLTSQPNGITDVPAGSLLQDYGTLKAGTANGLAKLGSVEGTLVVGSGQTLTDTPGSGTLTISSGGELDVDVATNLTVSGNLTNSGLLYTNGQDNAGDANTLTVTGTFTNNLGASTRIGVYQNSSDVMNVATLVNNGSLIIGVGATLNLTSQPNGITDVVAGSTLQDYGTLKAGTANGLAKLGSVEGSLVIGSGQTFTDMPSSGTLTISNTGSLDVDVATSLTVNGNLTNSGDLYTNAQDNAGDANTLTVTGTFTNNSGATTRIGVYQNSSDVMNVATLVNNGSLTIGVGATLNLTSQPSGITDVAAGSTLQDYGTLKAGTNFGLANLGTVAGTLIVANNQTDTITGTLIISSGGVLDVDRATNLTINGNLTNSGDLYTNAQDNAGDANTLTVTGTLTNNLGATTTIGVYQNSSDVMNVATLSNAGTLNVYGGAMLVVTNAGTLTNTGTINIGTGSGAGALKISGNTTLTGTTGKVILSDFASNIIGGTGTLTNVKNTISGSGNIGNGTMGLNNQGTVDANQSVPLIINAAGIVSNSLTMEATNGAILQLDAGTYTQTSAGSITASETGNLTSTVNLESGVVINGGKLTVTGTTASIDLVGTNPLLTLNGVSISGTGKLILPDGSTTTLMGTISNTSTIDVNGATTPTKLVVGAASVSLTGTGKIILSNNANNEITGAASADIFHNGNTIEGAGNIGEANMGLVNTGTILANQTTLLEIDVSSAGFSNQGIVQANTNDTLYITGAANSFLNFSGTTLTGGTYIVDGALKFDGANIATNAANITLSGVNSKITDQTGANALANFATNNGTFALAAGRSFTTAAAFTNNGTLNIGGGTKFAVGTSGTADLTNYSSDTLTGGTYLVTGTLQFNNAGTTMGIVTNNASITLSGASAKIEDQNDTSLLTNFATNGSGATFDVTSGNVFTTGGSFTNNGTLIVGSNTSKFIVNSAASLTNFSGTTLTGGTYDVTGLLQFAGANIVTNAANITLTGTAAAIENSVAGNGLANFAVNNSGASFDVTGGKVFTTGGNFTNNGTLTVGSSTSKFIVNSANTLTNFSGTTLTGGTYNVTGLLQFAGANIVNNAANITLTGTTSAIENSTAGNGLANFANNTSSGSFTLTGNRSFTTLGAFTNAGVMVINKGSTFTVTGASNNYTQSAGSTTVDGTLTVNAASMVDITGGNLFGATGNINGNVDLTGGVVNPGDGVNLIGELKITGTYTQGSAGATTIDLGGKTAITQYSVLDITKAATLSGTLNVSLVNGFTPVAGDMFTILDYLSTSTMYTTTNLPSVAGDHWILTYNAKNLVLSLVTGPGANVVVDDLTSASASASASTATASTTTAQSTVHGAPATRVSTFAGAVATTSNAHEPVAILSRATCLAARLVGSASCGAQSPATGTRRGEMHAVASMGAGSHEVHNNIMVATRTVSSAPGGASHESSASATAMARLYVCAYMPSTVARNMGCN